MFPRCERNDSSWRSVAIRSYAQSCDVRAASFRDFCVRRVRIAQLSKHIAKLLRLCSTLCRAIASCDFARRATVNDEHLGAPLYNRDNHASSFVRVRHRATPLALCFRHLRAAIVAVSTRACTRGVELIRSWWWRCHFCVRPRIRWCGAIVFSSRR